MNLQLPTVIDCQPHHIGYAVTDLDHAMREIGDLFGLRWCQPTLAWDNTFRTAGISAQWPLDVVKSTGEDGLVVELLQGGPGSTWYTEHGIVFHHFAYAPERTHTAHDAMLAAGWTVDLTHDVDNPRQSTFAYFVKPDHPRVELCLP